MEIFGIDKIDLKMQHKYFWIKFGLWDTNKNIKPTSESFAGLSSLNLRRSIVFYIYIIFINTYTDIFMFTCIDIYV